MAAGLWTDRTTLVSRAALSLLMLPQLCGAAPATLPADDLPTTRLGQISEHRHDPIVVRSRPVIERLPLQVISPTDLCTGSPGVLFVADAEAECVFRISSGGDTALAVQNEAGIRRIVASSEDTLFMLTVSSGSSGITQVSANGFFVPVGSLPYEATGFTRSETGELFVGSAEGTVVRFDSDGGSALHARCESGILDLTVSSSGQLFALLDTRDIVLITDDGLVRGAGSAEPRSIRLFSLPAGKLASLSPQPGDRPVIAETSADRVTRYAEFARVPSGTVAVAFDRLGNLNLANPDLRAITRVTSHFLVPCPHCGQDVPMHFSPDAPVKPAQRRF